MLGHILSRLEYELKEYKNLSVPSRRNIHVPATMDDKMPCASCYGFPFARNEDMCGG
jgi:hypothetical protein